MKNGYTMHTSSHTRGFSSRSARRRPCLAGAVFVTLALLASGCAELGGVGGSSSTSPAAAPPSGAKSAGASTAKTASKSGVYAVTFGVKGGALGAVQFEARPRANGRWQGSGDKVACTSHVAGAMHACDAEGGALSCGLIDTKGFGTPADVVTCSFESSAPVAAGDFSIKVVDASTPGTKPVRAEVVVTRVAAR